MIKKDTDEFLEYCGITATASTLKKIEIKLKQIDEYFKEN